MTKVTLEVNAPKDGVITELKVNEGDIVVTPKFVRHFTEPHKSKQVKRIISWDMNIL